MIPDLENWQIYLFFLVFYLIGFLHGRFPQTSRSDIKRIKKTTNEMYWSHLHDINEERKRSGLK